jgi:hypothetical protein
MFTGLAAIARAMQAALDVADIGVKATEMTTAAGSVIRERVGMMTAVHCNPLTADYAELGRMIPEKMDAFSEAGAAVFDEWLALHRDVGDYMLFLGRTIMSGRPPIPSEAVELTERTSAHNDRVATSVIAAVGVALAPFHRKATSNARRLVGRKAACLPAS